MELPKALDLSALMVACAAVDVSAIGQSLMPEMSG